MNYIEWIFSGIGVAILTWLISFISKVNGKKKEPRVEVKHIDESIFISEYPPDGISITVGTIMEKSWTIQNNGNMTWTDKYLECVSYVPDVFFPEKKTVKIPKTRPGEKFTLRVRYHAKIEGDYFSEWKMFDENGKMMYPKKHGLGLYVKVVKKGDYIRKK